MATTVLAGFIPGMDRYTFWLPPGYFLTLAALFRFVGPGQYLLAMRLFSWFLGVLLLGLARIILRRLALGPRIVWLGLMLLATHPTFIRAANLGRMEMLTLVSAAGAVALYLEFLERGGRRRAAAAGFLCGLAGLCHPAGVIIFAALALHFLFRSRFRGLAEPEIYVFSASSLVPFLPWLVYILQAPQFFWVQFGGQFARKTAGAGNVLENGNVIAWLIRPLQSAEWGRRGISHWADFLAAVVFLLGLFFLILPGREKTKARVLGLWVMLGFALNLVSLEDWYPIYFILPAILLLTWGAAEAKQGWARALGVVVILAGLGRNLVLAYSLFNGRYGTESDYRRYASAIAAHIPPGSSVLLMATPDPYFGLESLRKGYRLLEFVPEGIPVDPRLAETALASVDYVVDSGCCNPVYVRDYLVLHGKLEGGAVSPVAESSPVWIWKLHSRL